MPDKGKVSETEIDRARRVRIKLLTTILTNVGYGVMAVTVIQPMSGGAAISARSPLEFGLGLAWLAMALYIAPQGEPR